MLVLVGAWQASYWVAIFAATGLVLGACYMLWLYRRVVFGRAEKPEILELAPLNNREYVIFVPLTILVLWFGVYPSSLLDIMQGTVLDLLEISGAGTATQTALR
jgi:NADH-quinone oxidoreductase subunit M